MLKWCCKSNVEAVLQKTMLQMWCWSDVAKDDAIKVVLKWCCRRWCCKSNVEALLKWCCRRCWNGVAKNVPPIKITCAFVASKCTLAFFFSLFLFHSCPLAKKTIMNVALVFIFYCFYEIRAKYDDECNVLCHFLLFLRNHGRRQQWTCPVLVFYFFLSLHCRKQWWASPFIVVFYNSKKKKKKNPTKDDKPSSLLSSFVTQEKNLDVGFSWVVGDNNGPPGLSSCFNYFSSFVENNKLRGSLLFLGFIP